MVDKTAAEIKAEELAEEQANEKYTKEITSDFKTFGPEGAEDDRGVPVLQEIAGVLESVERVNMQGGPVGRYKIEREDGLKVGFLGGAILDDKLGGLEIGTDVRIVFDGFEKAKPGKSPMKLFRVYVAE